ncbi:hypothetical protein HID58_047569 [Brassica napus]|uniref:Uncharacterized protein n=1 Tax=Brassica napus TaxID=3708 RepID=A0ABQ8AZP4_BRANA|nr:hypothetical protein HID58_047569 [Brassica napus]
MLKNNEITNPVATMNLDLGCGHSLDWFPLIFIIKLLSAVSNVKLTSSTEIHSSIAIRFTFLAKFIEITTPPTTIFTELFRFQNFGHLTSLAKTNTQFPDISLIKTTLNDDAQTTPL